nr:hypothetical protein [uncultured Ruminococcus sp.]
MNTKIITVILSAIAALITLVIAIKYDIIWMVIIAGALIVVCAIRCINLSRLAEQEAWDKHRFISRTLNEIERELLDELHKELAGIKGRQPESNVHPGSRVSDKYLKMVENRGKKEG